MGKRIDDTTGGNSGVEPRLGVMYTEMVVRRGYSLPRYVDLVSTNAAKIMGLYPRKGAIAVGSDADIAILDPTPARQGARGGPARDRLHALGGPRHLRLAGRDDPARQGGGRERAVPGPRRRGPVPQAQDPAPRSSQGRCCERGTLDQCWCRSCCAQSLGGLARRAVRCSGMRMGRLALTAASRAARASSRAAPGVPFRWMLCRGRAHARRHVHCGLAARPCRATVDPGYRPARLRIAPSPVVAP